MVATATVFAFNGTKTDRRAERKRVRNAVEAAFARNAVEAAFARNAVEAAFARDRADTDADARGWLDRVRPGLRDALRSRVDERLAAEFPEI